MMQEEDVTAAEQVVPNTAEEKKEDSETQEETSTMTGSLSDEGVGASETSIADRIEKTKDMMKDFGNTVAVEKPKQMFADIQGMASNLKERVAFSNKPGDGESDETGEKVDPMEMPRQLFAGMKEKASSFKVSFNSLADGGASSASPDGETGEKVDPMEKPRQIFAGMKKNASSFKGFSFNSLSDSGVTNPSSDGGTGEKVDPMEKPRQIFAGMKKNASSFKGFSFNSLSDSAATNTSYDADLDATSDEQAAVEGSPNDALERSKVFFTGMKEKASSFKMKLPLAKDEEFDEYGKAVPGPLDRMKADMKDLASGIRGKMASTNSQGSADGLDDGTPGRSSVFTISEDHEENDYDKLAASNRSVDMLSSSHRSMASNDLSVKVSGFINSAKHSAHDSLSSMPSLASFYASDSSLQSFGLSDRFSSFRNKTISPISEKLGFKHTKEPESEEVQFFQSTTGDKIPVGPEPTIVKELCPEFKEKKTSSAKHWENVLPKSTNDTRPSMARRLPSIASLDTSAHAPSPQPYEHDTSSLTISENES
ncbi:unnamed protein product [Cylindrotheca closterium]|uniref:Uncharacterized protein n=1 Tax=Cylindrotheca closterium TaxID=2856 RepID=A0AAD2G8S7_9STRA|nr:unnamed protein product [Cylindrotheca closterium]